MSATNTDISTNIEEPLDDNLAGVSILNHRNREQPKPKDKAWLLDLESKLSLVGGKENAETKEHKEYFTSVSNVKPIDRTFLLQNILIESARS